MKHEGLRFQMLVGAAAFAAAVAGPANAVKITEFAIPDAKSSPSAITAGPDGRLWFTESAGMRIGAITVEGVLSEYQVQSHPSGITVVPGSGLAFVETSPAMLGLIGVNGTAAEAAAYVQPISIALGPEGRLWVADDFVASYTTARHLESWSPATEPYALSDRAWNVAPGPDGRMWMTLQIAGKVAACPPGGGTCTEYALPPLSGPTGIAAGPDGNVWVAEHLSGKIGRLTTDGVLTEFSIPNPNGHPSAICAGPDGAMWFADDNGKIGRITTSGVAREWAVPSPGSQPLGIAAGPDGALWFTESVTGKVGRLQPFVPGDVDGDGDVNVTDVFYLINFLFAGGPAPKI